jgi:hypothetical protein
VDELRAKIAKFLFINRQLANDDAPKWEQLDDDVKADWFELCDSLATLLKSAGYIKKPEGEPPILSDQEIRAAMKEAYRLAQDYGDDMEPLPEKNVARRQRDADKKWYEGIR